MIDKLGATMTRSFHRAYMSDRVLHTHLLLIDGNCNHLISEDPRFITPTSSKYWIDLIINDSREMQRSIIVRYANNSAYGAAWLMTHCCLNNRIDLALAILQKIEVSKTSTRFIGAFANFTPIIVAIHEKLGLCLDYLIKLGAIYNNIELLEYVFIPTEHCINEILRQARVFSHYKNICTWLSGKCAHDAALMKKYKFNFSNTEKIVEELLIGKNLEVSVDELTFTFIDFLSYINTIKPV
jgi:hypothetical protein